MQVRKSFALSGIWSSTCLLILSSLLSVGNAQKIPFENFTIQNGLPQNTVNDIDQDQEGYIWFATQVGAARFDGYEFDYFNSSNGLPDDYVNCLLVDGAGKVWMGTEKGIAAYDGMEFSYYSTEDGLVDNRIDGLMEDREGRIWVTTAYGLSVIAPNRISTYTDKNALVDNSITDLFIDSKGRVHVASVPGLTIFENPDSSSKHYEELIIRDIIETSSGDIWYATQEQGIIVNSMGHDEFLSEQDGLTDHIVFSLLEDHQGRIWCGTYSEGILRYEKGRFDKMFSEREEAPFVAEMFEDKSHRIWFRTFEDGVWLYNQQEFRHITANQNLLHNNVSEVFEDKYGNIWFGTLAGASKYGRVIFEIFDRDMGLPENHITSVYLDSKGRIWFGTYGSLLYQDHLGTNIMDEASGFPLDALPLSFAENRDGNLYIGTDIGLYRYDGDAIEHIETEAMGVERSINSMLNASEGDLWCATDSGIYVVQVEKNHQIASVEGLVNVQVNSMALFGNRIACATEGGVSVFNRTGDTLANFNAKNGLESEVCIDITFDVSGNIWVATNRGIYMIGADLKSVNKSYHVQDGLSSNTTYFVEFSEKQDLWIGTEKGINVINSEGGEIDHYGFDDGFYPMETNARAVSKGPAGELWIGTVEGLVVYNPLNNYKDQTPPDLILYPPEVEGESIEGDQELLMLPHNRNSLSFTYTAIHTTSPSQNKFTYKLEGFDKEWSMPVSERSKSYERLPVGSYVFRLRAFNLDGIPSESEANFSFTIQPPFWKTPWFILFEVLTGLLLVFGVIKIRERQLIREKRALERKVKERTSEIEDQKLEIEVQRDHIVLQNKEITSSIQYAKRIQQAVLPGKEILEKHLPDHFIFFKPRDIVSGDFYWIEEKEGLIIACAADCTGHGVPGAFMSLLGLTFLNQIVTKDGATAADEILNRLRSHIISTLSNQREGGETKDGMDLAMVVLDREKDQLEYAGAYNPLILIRGNEMIEYKADKMPIGQHIGADKPFQTNVIPLQEGDMIYLFSDGYQDQFGGEKDAKYKSKPFKRLLQRISSEPAMDQAELLENELTSWMGNTEQVDDILILGMRYTKVNLKSDQL